MLKFGELDDVIVMKVSGKWRLSGCLYLVQSL
jgi:hypothetical protein